LDLNVLFLGTSPFAIPSLRMLAESGLRSFAAVTRPDRPAGRGKKSSMTPVKAEALKYNITLFQPEGRAGLLEVLEKTNPELLINVAFGMFLPPAVLDYPPLGCINLHPSLLPAYRGAAPIQRALMSGEEYTGVTVLYMSPELDAGDIILQEKTGIGFQENYGSLHDRLAELGAVKLLQALKLLEKGAVPRIQQDDEKATYAPPLTRDEERIIWNSPAIRIYNQVRSLDPAPGAYTRFRNKRLKVWKTVPVGKDTSQGTKEDFAPLSPGTVSSVTKECFEVASGRGFLRVLELQPEGKKRMSTRDFLKGYQLKVGESFE
jgi:methionyl-tRNA formyltransferase